MLVGGGVQGGGGWDDYNSIIKIYLERENMCSEWYSSLQLCNFLK